MSRPPANITFAANGLKFHALSWGNREDPLLLCLHGFPDYPRTFQAQGEHFADRGYHVVAPFMRGYHPDSIDPEGCYQTAALARDAVAMIDALGGRPAVVYGHDWGTTAAQGCALLAPEKVSKLITSAVPYGDAFWESLVTSPEQQRKSWYIFYFQLPVAEVAVALNDYAFIRRLWQDWSPDFTPAEGSINGVIETLKAPGVLEAALGYYRSAFNPALTQPRYAEDQAQFGQPITVPTLHLHGADDGCIGKELLTGTEELFSNGIQIEIVLTQ